MTRRLTGIPRRRLATHGDFAESAAVSQRIKDALMSGRSWRRMSAAQREAAQMNAFKLARIVCGDPDHADHWDDVAGYAQLARAAIPKRVIASAAKQSRPNGTRLLRRFAPRNDSKRRRA